MEKQNQQTGKKPLLITTAHRGVFFGYAIPTGGAKVVRLEQAQMCVYWSADMKGVMGLASVGPSKECRIGPPVPAITLQDVTSEIEVSAEAEAKWKQQPWK